MLGDEEKMDFSKWIGRRNSNLCILGNKNMLKSIDFGYKISFEYNNLMKKKYNDPVDYEVIEEKDLKYGDIFIDDRITNPTLKDFEVFMGRDQAFYYVQFLYQRRGIDLIESLTCIKTNLKVKRFLRK